MNIAYGSCIEVMNNILLAREFQYLDDNAALNVRKISLITNQIRALNKTVASKKQINERT